MTSYTFNIAVWAPIARGQGAFGQEVCLRRMQLHSYSKMSSKVTFCYSEKLVFGTSVR